MCKPRRIYCIHCNLCIHFYLLFYSDKYLSMRALSDLRMGPAVITMNSGGHPVHWGFMARVGVTALLGGASHQEHANRWYLSGRIILQVLSLACTVQNRSRPGLAPSSSAAATVDGMVLPTTRSGRLRWPRPRPPVGWPGVSAAGQPSQLMRYARCQKRAVSCSGKA